MMGRARREPADRGVARLRLLCLLGALIVVVPISADPPSDPIPIQRIQLPPERVAAEMKRLRRGVLARLPREQFEALVREAARAEAGGAKPPQLLECHYRARLEGDGLAGTAEWKLLNPAPGAGRMALDAFQVALREAKWADKSPAIIARLDDKPGAGMQLFVARPGEATLHLGWSARGAPEPGAIRFDLRLQPCAITVLELDLPSDRMVSADRDSLVVSGPMPSGTANLSRWQLTFSHKAGGATNAQFAIRRAARSDSLLPVARPLIQTTQRLMPGVVESEFVLDLQVDRGGLSTFDMICDRGLRVHELEAPGLESWESKLQPNGETLVQARLRDPIRGGRVTLRAVSPLPAPDKAWASPGVRVAGGISRGEKLTLLVHPDLELQDWKPGGFRPASGPAGVDSMQAIFLQNRSVAATSTQRPEARIRLALAAFDLEETMDWTIEPDRMSLTVDSRVTARRGASAQLVWAVPAGWEVEHVDGVPSDPALRWQVKPDRTVTIEPGRPVPESRDSEERRWIVRLRAAGPKLEPSPDGPSATLAWPDLKLRNVRQREGRLTIRVNPGLIAVAAEGNPIPRSSAIAYAGAPRGVLQVRPRRGRLQARIESDTTIRGSSAITTYRLDLTPGIGSTNDAYLLTSAPVLGEWNWKTIAGSSRVQRVEPLPLAPAWPALAALMPYSAWDALGRSQAAAVVAGQWWRIVFEQPLQKPVTLQLTSRAIAGRSLEVPLMSVVGADRIDAHAELHLLPGAGWTTTSSGVRELPAAAETSWAGWETRSFRYGAGTPSLLLQRDGAAGASPRVDGALVTISPALEGRTLYRFDVAINGWMQRELPVRLPRGTNLIAAYIDGAAVTMASSPRRDDSPALLLPWTPGEQWRFVRIVYGIEGPANRGIKHVEVAMPELPFAVRARQVWRLPPGVTPLTQESWRMLPDAARRPALSWLRRDKSTSSDFRRLPFEDAARATPPRPAESLGQWLERWGYEHRETSGMIVVDLPAIGESGLGPRMPIDSSSSFESAAKQLEILATTKATLLTTARRLIDWGGQVPADAAAAIESAAECGFDDSGRFIAIMDWVASAGDRPGASGWDSRADGFVEWEPPVGSNISSLILVESPFVSIVGIAIALVLWIAGSWIRKGRRIFLLAWLLIAASGLIWLPKPLWGFASWPLVAGLTMTVLAWFRIVWKPRRRLAPDPSSLRNARPSSLVIPLGLILIVSLTMPTGAAGPEPILVYVAPNEPNQGDAFSVFAPPELIDRLKEMAHRHEPGVASVITQARYEGAIDGTTIRWDAGFEVYCFNNEPAALTIPLAGGQLRRARWDGVEVLPRAGADPGHLLFNVRGQGRHSLRLEFDAAIEGVAVHESRCVGPDAAISSISLRMPNSARFPIAPAARGAQRIVESKSERRLEADLGRGGVLQLRWYDAPAAPMPRPQVDEVSMWDMSNSGARLRSVFRYRLGAAATDALGIAIPDGLELSAAAIRSVDERAVETVPIFIKEWRQVKPGQVRLELQPALSGQVQLNLELTPRQPLDARPILPVPGALGDFDRATEIAIRLQDFQAKVFDSTGWSGISAAALFRDRWQALRVDTSDQEPDLAFRRISSSAPGPRISLQLPEAQIEGGEEIVWRVGPDRADLRATATWPEAPPSGPLEWIVPSDIAVSEIRGAGIRSWSRSGNVIQVWLGFVPAGGRVTFTLVGSLARPISKQPPAPSSFDLPMLSLGGVARQSVFTQVLPREGWRIAGEKSTGWFRAPSTDLPGASWTAFGNTASRAAFSLHPVRGLVDCRCVTYAEASGRSVAFTGVIDIRPAGEQKPGSIETIAIEVRQAEADKLQLQLPPGVRLRETRSSATGATWMVDCLPGRHRIGVTGRVVPAQSRDFAMPAVRARGVGVAAAPRRWLVVGPGLRPRDLSGLRVEPPEADLLDATLADKIRRAANGWAVQDDAWRMRLEFGPAAGGTGAAAFASSVDASAAPGDDGFWLIQVKAFAFQETENPWSVHLPGDGRLVAFTIDGIDGSGRTVNDRRPSSRSIPSGLHSLRLVWRTAVRNSEPPPLALPVVEIGGERATWPSVLWTAAATPGSRLVPAAESMGAAKMDLSRAAAWLEFHRQVADRSSLDSLQPLRSALQSALRRADVDLAATGPELEEFAPDGKSLADWLKQMRENAPTATNGRSSFEAYFEPFHRGIPVHWRAAAGETATIKLEPTTPTVTDKWAVSGFLALLLTLGAVLIRRAK